MRRRSSGFTLAELLIVVAIIGIISAIAIPRLRNAIDRGRQRRTMGDIRTLALAVNSYGVDFVQVPQLSSGHASALAAYLTPTYLRALPKNDGWNRDIIYMGSGLDYTIWSFAGDGLEQGELTYGRTTSFRDDIVLNNGVFLQWPEGMQSQ